MSRIISSTPPIYTLGVPADAPSIGRRITHAANPSTSSLSTFNSLKPQSLSIPRIRILLAPYMSPFVVPMHKVETWDLLHKSLQSLFGLDIFGSSVRITDHLGNSILPSVWVDLLEPDMTIIVDTCSLQSENSPVIFETPKLRSFSPPMSPTYTIRESEDSCYDNASTFITPRGVIGQALPMTPPNPMTTAGMFNVHSRKPSIGKLKNRARKSEEEKRNTSVSMFTGMSPKQSNAQTPKSPEKEKEEQPAPKKKAEDRKKKEQDRNSGAHENKTRSKHFRSTVSRFARALIRVLSAGTIQSSKEGKNPEKPKRGASEKPRRTITMEAIENNPGKIQPNARIYRMPAEPRTVSISRRRGIPSPPPVITPPTLPSVQTRRGFDKIAIIPPELSFINAEPRRSRSLSHLKLTSTIISTKTTSSTIPSPVGSIKRLRRSKSFTPIRNSNKLSVISPPIPPRRPSLELGTNAQYKSLSMDKAAIQEIFSDMDAATLGPGTRSRSGTGDTSSTDVSLSPTLVSFDKPLPKLPFKFSAFPAPSPPRSPLLMTGWQKGVLRPITPNDEEEYGRPATAVTRKITKITLRKVVSSDFGAMKRKGMIGGLF